jgi:quinol monooxygenase YgiN
VIVYEVNLSVDWAVADAYRRWLTEHVDAMLRLPGFIDAQRFDVLQSPAAAERAEFCVHYRLRDAAALDAYLQQHAPAMRADGVARFGERFSATRRILQPVVEAGPAG